MEDLPKDLIFDILFRVPVKTIARCRCVCKTLRKLVSHSYFVNRHRLISPPCLIVQKIPEWYNIKKPRSLKLVELFTDDIVRPHSCINLELGIVERSSDAEHIIPLGSVNGLICLLIYKIIVLYSNNGREKLVPTQIYISNPITNDYYKIIPKFYSSNQLVRYGFGVSLTGEYKVIQIYKRKTSREYVTEIEVYTLGKDQWRSLGRVPNFVNKIEKIEGGLALNGRVHWLDGDIIYAFDLDTETVLQIPTPSGEEWINYPFLGVLKGCVSLFARSQSYDRFSVWAMKEDGIERSWHKTWSTEEYKNLNPECFYFLNPKCLIDGINGTSILIGCNRTWCLETDISITNDYRGWIPFMTCCPGFVKLPKPGVGASSYGSKGLKVKCSQNEPLKAMKSGAPSIGQGTQSELISQNEPLKAMISGAPSIGQGTQSELISQNEPLKVIISGAPSIGQGTQLISQNEPLKAMISGAPTFGQGTQGELISQNEPLEAMISGSPSLGQVIQGELISQNEPLKAMISGAPSLGQGTQCELIVQKHGGLHRTEVATGSDIGNQAKESMNSGRLVPDEVVTNFRTSAITRAKEDQTGCVYRFRCLFLLKRETKRLSQYTHRVLALISCVLITLVVASRVRAL